MADTKISALTSGNPAQSGDEIPIARSGANYKITAGSIASLSSTPPGGSNTQVQFNNSGAFGGSANLTWDGTNVQIGATGALRLADTDSSNYVAFKSPGTVASNVTWTLPSADGTSNQVLTTNGLGTLSWSTPSGSGDVVGPASAVDNQIALFNSTTGKLIKAATTTGLLKASSGVIAAAVSSTDYAPATTGTSAQLLANSGSGGFANVTVGSGLTLSSGTLTASGGGLAWQSVQTSAFTASAGNAYPCNTTSAAFTVTLPASPSAGDLVTLTDYAGTFGTNNLTVNPNGLKIQGDTANKVISTSNNSVNLVYIDSTRGWLVYSAVTSTPFPPPASSVDYLVVAGGGGGGSYYYSGGGGAGGLRAASTQTVTAGSTLTITVGGGGAGGTGGGAGNNGNLSSIVGGTSPSPFASPGVSCTGGGRGATGGTVVANTGGSGGGGAGDAGANAYTAGKAGTAGEGNAGADGVTTRASSKGGRLGSGGGGAGAAAVTPASGDNGGSGGAGSSTAIISTTLATSLGVGQVSGGALYFAGGGGGAGDTAIGSGGVGGGGNGAAWNTIAATSGSPYSGGGGGAACRADAGYNVGGSGGGGIVIIAYPDTFRAATTTGSPTVDVSGGYRRYIFTGNGTITF